MIFQIHFVDEPSLGNSLVGVTCAVDMALASVKPNSIARLDLHLVSGYFGSTTESSSKVLDIRSGIDYDRLRKLDEGSVEYLFDVAFEALLDALPEWSNELNDAWTHIKASRYRPTYLLWKKKHGSALHQINIQFGPSCATLYHETISATGDRRRDKVMDVHPSSLIYSMLFNSFALTDDGIVVSSNPIIARSFVILKGEEGLRSIGAGPNAWDEWSLLLAEYVACGTSNERRLAIINS